MNVFASSGPRICCKRVPLSFRRLYAIKTKLKPTPIRPKTASKRAPIKPKVPKEPMASDLNSNILELLDTDELGLEEFTLNNQQEEFEFWSSFADQSTSTTNSPDREIQKVTYSYISSEEDAPMKAKNKEAKPTATKGSDGSLHLCTYSVSVNNGRLRFILPKLDITKTWSLLDLDKVIKDGGGKINDKNLLLNAKMKNLEKLGRNFSVIKSAQILFLQKYRLEPPNGSILQKLESEFNFELKNHNLGDTRFVLEIKKTSKKDGTSTIERHEIPTQHHTFFTYLGLATVEDSLKLAPRVIYRFLRKCNNETLQQTIWDSNEVEFDKENVSALREINNSLKGEIPPCQLNEIVFSSLSRPILLRFNNEYLNLPSLPNIKAVSEFPYLLELVFGGSFMQDNVYSTSTEVRIKKLSFTLDKIGDRILHILAQEYYSQRKALFDSLTRSNALLGRLVYLYDFPRANLRANKDKDKYQPLAKGVNDFELERLGDIFEKFIAITFMTDSKACLKWLFAIFDTIHEAIMISLYQKDVQSFTDASKLNLRFKPKAPEIEYVSREIGEAVEKFVLHLVKTKSAEMRSIRRSFKVKR